MKILRGLMGGAAVLALAAAPVASAAGGPAARLSLNGQIRAASATGKANHVDSSTAALAVLGAVAVIGLIVIISDDDDKFPDSP